MNRRPSASPFRVSAPSHAAPAPNRLLCGSLRRASSHSPPVAIPSERRVQEPATIRHPVSASRTPSAPGGLLARCGHLPSWPGQAAFLGLPPRPGGQTQLRIGANRRKLTSGPPSPRSFFGDKPPGTPVSQIGPTAALYRLATPRQVQETGTSRKLGFRLCALCVLCGSPSSDPLPLRPGTTRPHVLAAFSPSFRRQAQPSRTWPGTALQEPGTSRKPGFRTPAPLGDRRHFPSSPLFAWRATCHRSIWLGTNGLQLIHQTSAIGGESERA